MVLGLPDRVSSELQKAGEFEIETGTCRHEPGSILTRTRGALLDDQKMEQ